MARKVRKFSDKRRHEKGMEENKRERKNKKNEKDQKIEEKKHIF